MTDDLIPFADETQLDASSRGIEPWKLLVVDDDPEVHHVTQFVLHDRRILGRPVCLLHAYDGLQARSELREHPDVAVALLDVVMETERAGLDLVGYIRDDLGLAECRIILRTGQPGYAPELTVINEYDINDYRTKAELTHGRLITTVSTALRAYQQLHALAEHRRGLDLIIHATSDLMEEHAISGLAEGVLTQLAALLRVPPDGIVCTHKGSPFDGDGERCYVVGAAGQHARYIAQPLEALPDHRIVTAILASVEQRQHVFGADYTVLYLRVAPRQEAAIFFASGLPLAAIDQSLIEVFIANITTCFRNARLVEHLQQAQQEMFEAKERAQVTLHSIGDAVITTDAHAVVDYLNPVAETLSGWTATEAKGRRLSQILRIVNEQSRQPVPDPVEQCLREGRIINLANYSVLIDRRGHEYFIDDSAAPIRGHDGQVLGAVLVFHDISETRRLTHQLEHDATHDALTGLINRREFERRLERALTSAQEYGCRHALCYLDLDQFKVVNDTAGHAAGDELLRQIKTLLSRMFRERDTLARIGGDEFGLLIDNCPLDRAQLIAQTMVSTIRDHVFHWNDRTYQIGVSIGLVPITAEAQDIAQLLTQADVACYTAKETGRNRVHVYEREDSETVLRHSEMLGAAGLRDALEQGRFRLHYQPIVALSGSDERPVRYEALLRVAHTNSPNENTELVLPSAFIPAAERFGLMGAIDRWVIQAVFREFAAGAGQTGARIALNLSGNSLSDDTLLDFIESQFAAYAVPAERVCFEITETAAIQNLRHARDLMTALKRRGSQFALDDFGSGLSSFHYLKTLPVDYLKIDGSFVKDMMENDSDCALVAAINQMSHTLGIQTIAEYAHSRAIVERLRELGVDYAQGYCIGPPAPWQQDLNP